MDPTSIIAAIGGSGGIGLSVWTFVKERVKANDRKQELEAFERRITSAEQRATDAVSREIETLKGRIVKLEQDHADCEKLLRAEIRRSTLNALTPRRADEPIPDQLPHPNEEWYERTGARIMWDEETQKVISEAKRKRDSDPRRSAAPRPGPPVAEREREDMRPRAIVIDDESIAAHAILRVLVDIVPKDWKVETLTDARAGRVVLIMDARVRFAIVDYLMPRFDGEAVITEALKQRPELRGKIIVTSGWPLPKDVADHLFNDLGCLWLKKPIEFQQLQKLVWQVTR